MSGITLGVIATLCALAGVAVLWMVLRVAHRSAQRRVGGGGFEVVSDLDAILTRTVSFKFQGKQWGIAPLSFEDFLKASNAMAFANGLASKLKVTEDELLDAYAGLFEAMKIRRVDGALGALGWGAPMGRKDVENMTQQQVAVVVNLVLQQIMGKPKFDEEKKSPNVVMKGKPGQA